MDEDLELLRRFKEEGSLEAWNILYTRYYWRLWNRARFRVRDQAVLDDLVQETFLRVVRTSAWRQVQNVENWLCTILRNVVVDHRRREYRHAASREEDEDFKDPNTGPVDDVIGAEDRERLWACVEKLPGRLKEVVRLYYSEGLTLQAICDRVGGGVSGVHRSLRRAQELLLDCLGGENGP
jgi:RNA polymerase sigma factor (sigma-70 family)